jgi:hypothetical protein
MSEPREIEFLPLVKAYPALSRRYGEVSCIAGLDMKTSKWIRLYPVPFRTLEDAQKFRKYEPIRARVQRPRDDRRPESWRVDAESIEVVGPVLSVEHEWAARRPVVEPAIGESMCAVRKAQKGNGTSLQMFRPREVLELIIEDAETDPEKGRRAEDWAAQGSLLGSADLQLQRKALEQIPFRFLYRYFCAADDCPGHRQSIVDWEIIALYRKVRKQENWRDLIRAKWFDQMCGPDRDTAFIVGNQHQHPDGFLILGVWWPPRSDQLSLGNLSNV